MLLKGRYMPAFSSAFWLFSSPHLSTTYPLLILTVFPFQCTRIIYISFFGTSLFLFITKMWLLLIGAIVVLSFTHWVYSWRNPKCNGKLPPGSMGLPLLGETLQFFAPNTSSDIPPFIRKRMDRYLRRVCYVPSRFFSFSSQFWWKALIVSGMDLYSEQVWWEDHWLSQQTPT